MRQIELSPAVERVLQEAREMAGLCGAVASHPLHVMHCLFSDESRAHAILTAAGYTLNDLLTDFELDSEGYSDGEPVKVDDRDVEAALQQCRRWLRESPGESEIRTEHLLAALAVVDPDCTDLFTRLNLTPDEVRGAPHASTEPLVIDEPHTGATGSASATQLSIAISESAASSAGVLRILDAAANRGREGLRVIEDAARFLLNDAHLCGLLKSLRHELAIALQQLGSDHFHASRDTTGDVGTAITTSSESERSSAAHVLRANCKRVEESLRSLEEYGKLIDPAAAATIEQLRYRFYTLEKALLISESNQTRLADCRLYLLVTETACRTGFERVVKGALDGGVDVIQLREKDIDDRRLIDRAAQVRDWTTSAGALFILNDRPDLAVLSGADGVHVGQDDLTVQHTRQIIGPDRLVGVSTHSIEQARQAVLDGADYLGVGPTFPSQTKQFDTFTGLDFVRSVNAEIGLPWFPIGGISPDNITQVIAAGASRVAVSSAICGAVDAESMARGLRAQLS